MKKISSPFGLVSYMTGGKENTANTIGVRLMDFSVSNIPRYFCFALNAGYMYPRLLFIFSVDKLGNLLSDTLICHCYQIVPHGGEIMYILQ